jgi:chaperonin GroEL (HSP60 family)
MHALHAFHELAEMEPSKFVASALGCDQISINGRVNILLKTASSSLLLCAPTTGQSKQLLYDLQNTVKVILSWLNDFVVADHAGATLIPGGGCFEVLLSNIFKSCSMHHPDVNVKMMLDILHQAFLMPPLILLEESYGGSKSLAYLKAKAKEHNHRIVINAKSGDIVPATESCDVLQPVASKLLLVESVLHLTQQLLRIESVVHSKRHGQDESLAE